VHACGTDQVTCLLPDRFGDRLDGNTPQHLGLFREGFRSGSPQIAQIASAAAPVAGRLGGGTWHPRRHPAPQAPHRVPLAGRLPPGRCGMGVALSG
jgi:hypothetical protein